MGRGTLGVRRLRRFATVCVWAALLVTALAPAAAAGMEAGDASHRWSGRLTTPAPVGFAGSVHATGGDGLSAAWEDHAHARLEAARVRVSMEIATGYRASGPTEDGMQAWHQGSRTYENITFHDAAVTFTAWRSPGRVLVEPGGDGTTNASASARATASASLGTVSETVLAWAGAGGMQRSAGAESFPGYSYRVDGALAQLGPADAGRAQGDFDLFVDNVTLAVEEAGGGSWRNWTGFRTENATGVGPPAGPSPSRLPAGAIQRYELRITRLEVEDGRLVVQAPGSVDLLGGALEIDSAGSIQAASVTGRIASDQQALAFEDGSLVLAGQATSSAWPVEPGDGLAPGVPVPLSVTTAGQLRVISAEGATRTTLGSDPAWQAWLPGWLAWGLTPLVLVLGAGASAAWRPWLLRPLPAAWTARLYDRWERLGLKAEYEGEHARAARYYQRLTHLDPRRMIGWYLLARASLAAQAPRRVVEVVDEADGVFEQIALDLLEVKTVALLDLGEEDEAVRVVDRVAEESTKVAYHLVQDTGMEALVGQHRIQAWRYGPIEERGLDGYH